MLKRVGDFSSFLDSAADDAAIEALRRSYSTGRPLGARDWIVELEASLNRPLTPAARGRKPLSA
jgi:hypothetical protein